MNRADRLVSEETELGRERDHIRQIASIEGERISGLDADGLSDV